MTKKISMMCAARNTVITMLLLGVWEVEVWRVGEVEVGGEEERERREGKEEMVREHVCEIYFITNNKGNKINYKETNRCTLATSTAASL